MARHRRRPKHRAFRLYVNTCKLFVILEPVTPVEPSPELLAALEDDEPITVGLALAVGGPSLG